MAIDDISRVKNKKNKTDRKSDGSIWNKMNQTHANYRSLLFFILKFIESYTAQYISVANIM